MNKLDAYLQTEDSRNEAEQHLLLHTAVSSQRTQACQTLLAKGVDANYLDATGFPAFHSVLMNDDERVMSFFHDLARVATKDENLVVRKGRQAFLTTWQIAPRQDLQVHCKVRFCFENVSQEYGQIMPALRTHGGAMPISRRMVGESNEQEAQIVGEGPFYFCCLGPNCAVALDAQVSIKSVSLRLSDASKKVLRRDIKLMQTIGRFHELVREFIAKLDAIQIGQVKSDPSVYKQYLSDIGQSLTFLAGKLRQYRDQEDVLQIAELATRCIDESNDDDIKENISMHLKVYKCI